MTDKDSKNVEAIERIAERVKEFEGYYKRLMSGKDAKNEEVYSIHVETVGLELELFKVIREYAYTKTDFPFAVRMVIANRALAYAMSNVGQWIGCDYVNKMAVEEEHARNQKETTNQQPNNPAPRS